jgi:putative FmdB family regulatory protein
MARYEYRCRTCDDRFELRRPMSEADAPATCGAGHTEVVRLLSVFATVGASAGAGPVSAPASQPTGGGCGAACACHGA